MDQKDRMLSGKLYKVEGKTLYDAHKKSKRLLDAFNTTKFEEKEKRLEIIHDLFERFGERGFITPPFHCDYGMNVSIGDDFYANYDCILLDVNRIVIGDRVMFGPRVSLLTASHPIDKEVRNAGLEFGLPITIGDDVWFGGNVTVNPGVTIGSNVVIGSGAVVTKDIPDNVLAAGNPCKVIRKITEEDKAYWEKKKAQYEEEMESS
ncbi:MAG: sugar O-acetyltransferase [Bacillota bacterium]